MELAVTSYEFSVFIHITAVVVGFGATFAESVMFPVAMSTSPRHLPYLHRIQLVINRYFALPAILIVLATGIYQVEEGNWEWGDFWVSGSLTVLIVIAALNLFFLIPSDKRLLPIIERDVEAAGSGEVKPSEEYMRRAKLQGIFGTIIGLLLIVVIYLMVTKPGL